MSGGRVLVVRLDSFGDVLLSGPAVRALAACADHLTYLAGPLGRAAAALLPGVDDVWCWHCPWISATPPSVADADLDGLLARVRAGGFDRAVVLTSFHQSPLPTALLLRQAGVPWIGAISEDYPGSLLDLRHRVAEDLPEAERALDLAVAAGGAAAAGRGGLAVRPEVTAPPAVLPAPLRDGGFVVVHPGTSVPARAWPPAHHRSLVALLAERGQDVVVTGGAAERDLTAFVADDRALDLGGRTDAAGLAGVLAAARGVVVGNTGPAHLAAAVGTPVVSLFAPTVPAVRWRPHGVRQVLLGDQEAPCRDTRAQVCPVPGHPCLASVRPERVADALTTLIEEGRAA